MGPTTVIVMSIAQICRLAAKGSWRKISITLVL
jgi:hypothetical protein